MLIIKTCEDFQQQFANNIGYRGTIVWDRFCADDKPILHSKIKLLFPNLEENDSKFTEKEINNIKKENNKIIEKQNRLLEQIWAQRIYCGGNLKMAIVYVLVTPFDEFSFPCEDSRSHTCYKRSTTYTIHPVFRIWKCEVHGESKGCCNIFVDENGRVYENWIDFISNNNYPEGVLVAPQNGVYDKSFQNKVILQFTPTPSSTTLKKALQVADTSASVVGILGAAVPAGIAFFTPLALPVAIGALAIGGVTSVYAMGRSIANLVDRGQHKESINITDRQARLDWFSLFGGIFSLGASGATIGVATVISRGKTVSQIAEKAVKGASVAAIAVNGVGVGNGIAEVVIKVNQNEKFSSLEILHFSTSLLLFTHSIYNYNLASRIMEKSKTNTLEIENLVTDDQTQVVTKMFNETMRLKGGQSAQCNSVDLVRCLGKIPDMASGLIKMNLTPIMALRIAGTVKQIVDKYFVSNKIDLKNLINLLLQVMSDETIDFILLIAESFLHDILDNIESSIRPLIPFEHLIWNIFEISTKIRGFKQKLTKDFLMMHMDLIQKEFRQHFSEYLDRDSFKTIKCKKCHGSYQICKLTE